MESVFMISLPVGHRLKWDVRAMVKAFYHISVATTHFRTKPDVVRYSSICVRIVIADGFRHLAKS